MLYTDGLTDVLNPAGQRFGSEQLDDLLRAHAELSPAALCDATFAALADYQGEAEQYDDMTMLAVAVEN